MPDGSAAEGKEVYVLNADSREFMLIMTDVLDENSVEVINPLDTLQKKNKHSADYVRDKMNLVSVRDGSPGRMQFFIHFQRKNSDCNGELKGEAMFTGANSAVYRQAGDPCELQFSFTSSSVTLRETKACGNHRGVKCSFNATYPKKKELKPKPIKKK